MKEGYIGIPSLTETQRAAELLRRKRLSCTVTRMPAVKGVSCAYGLRLGENSLRAAAAALRSGGIRPGHILIRDADGALREWKP